MEEYKPNLPVLDDKTYALLRKYLFKKLSSTEYEVLQEKIKHLSTLDALQIGYQLKRQQQNFLQVLCDH